ncbi:hypothetical protein BJ170DRAFT_589933 [Xylariales sp. AK1849]|nr:hypothetical protein BJ170DRAFT_589933 [Xylariales sp. AK1849]
MSSGGGGGFYKYRCKYFYTHNCPNWVYVNHSPCASCCAEGREAEETKPGTSWTFSRDVFVPRAEDGTLYYTLMEVVNVGETGGDWTFQYKASQQPAATVVTTSATPGTTKLSTSL